MAVGNTFVVEKTCPICGKKTRVVKTRARLIATESDRDFCVHYRILIRITIRSGYVRIVALLQMKKDSWL